MAGLVIWGGREREEGGRRVKEGEGGAREWGREGREREGRG